MKNYCKHCGIEIVYDNQFVSWVHNSIDGWTYCANAIAGRYTGESGTKAEPIEKSNNFKSLYERLSV